MRHKDIGKSLDWQLMYYVLLLIASMIPDVINLFRPDLIWPVRVLNLILPLGLYILAFSYTRRIGYSILYMLPVLFLSAFQLVIFCLNKEIVISADMWLNLTTTNSGEVYELLHSLMLALIMVVVIYIPVIGLGFWGMINKWRLSAHRQFKMRMLSTVLLISSAVLVGVASFSGTHIASGLFPINAVSNLVKAVQTSARIANYYTTSADFTFNAERTDSLSGNELYIVVIGETSRADNWHLLGYGRPTTEALDNVDGLIAFTNVLSQSNTTHKSVPLLLSHLDAEQYDDSIYRVKSFITAFKEAGFNTAFFSTQQHNGSYIDFFGREADTCVYTHDDPSIPTGYDLALIELLKKELDKGHRKQLIVLHTYGSHFNYNERYSDDSRKFKPDRIGEADSKSKRELTNAYDNSIVSTAKLLRSIIDIAADTGHVASVIYTSDHGEDLYDDGSGRFLHASSIPSYYQLHVPMVMWLSESYRALNQKKIAAIDSNKGRFISSSSALFHTLMDVAGIHTPYYRKSHSLSSSDYAEPLALFLNDHNKAIAVERSGISSKDVIRISELQRK